jgi:hypothetical protein
VDGVEKELTQKELEKQIREYQKYGAADKRLEEATLKLKQLEEREATLKAREEEINKKKKDADKNDAATLEGYDDLVEDFAHALREGNDEDADKATKKFTEGLKKLAKASSSESIDVNALVKAEMEKIEAEKKKKEQDDAEEAIQEEVKKAKEKFEEVYENELKDDDFYDLAIMEDNKLLRQEEWQNKSVEERFLRAGENAKKWIEKQAAEKLRDKKKKLNQQSDRSVLFKLKDENDKESELTPSDTIREMKKARGQAV